MCDEQQFCSVRQKLDILGYQQLLGIESLPLVERLLSDLIKTTESLKELKSYHVSNDTQLPKEVIRPYQEDNAKLVRENNDLHLKNLHLEEDYSLEISKLNNDLKSKDCKIADVIFLNEQYNMRIIDLEKESNEKTKAINILQKKNLKAVVCTPGGKEKQIAFRRQRMNVDALVDENLEYEDKRNVVSKKESVDLIKICDSKIEKLENENKIFSKEIKDNKSLIISLNVQIKSRQQEIYRLQKLLDGGKPMNVITLENEQYQNERLITSIKLQMDMLQAKNDELNSKLAKSESREMQKIDEITRYKSLYPDCDNVSKLEENYLCNEIEQLKLKLESLCLENTKLKQNLPIFDENDSYKNMYQELNDMVNRLIKEKKKLAVRITNLLKREKEMCLKLYGQKTQPKNRSMTNLPPKSGFCKPINKNITSIKMEDYNVLLRDIEKDRDYWMQESHELHNLLGIRQEFVDFNKESYLTNQLSELKQHIPKGNDETVVHYSRLITAIEQERNSYRDECNSLREELKTCRSLKIKIDNLESEQNCLIDENRKFSADVVHSKKRIAVLMKDRMDLQREVSELTGKLRFDKVHNCDKIVNTIYDKSEDTTGSMRRLEHDRRDAITNLEKIKAERDEIRYRLKMSTESQLEDRSRLEYRNDEICKQLREANNDLKSTESEISKLHNNIDLKERELRSVMTDLDASKNETLKWRNDAIEYKNINVQLECARKDVDLRLEREISETRKLNNIINSQKLEIQELSDQLCAYKASVVSLDSKIIILDKERDDLQSMVDCKDERISSLKNEINDINQVIERTKIDKDKMSRDLNIKKRELSDKLQEFSSTVRSIDRYKDECNSFKNTIEEMQSEIRRLYEDISIMTREKQENNEKIIELTANKQDLKDKIGDFVLAVQQMDEMLMEKDKDKSELMHQYQQCTLSLQRLQGENQNYANENQTIKSQLMSREDELKCLRDRMATITLQSDEMHKKLMSSEDNAMEIALGKKTTEQQLEFCESEKKSYLKEVKAMRQQLSHYEINKDDIQKDLASKSAELLRLDSAYDNTLNELNSLRKHSDEQRKLSEELQDMLSNKRKREYELDLKDQDKEHEILNLKNKIKIFENIISEKDDEISKQSIKIKNNEIEFIDIQDKLTHERFERERVVQELKHSSFRSNTPIQLTSYSHNYSATSTSPNQISDRSNDESNIYNDDHTDTSASTKY
ncbi:Centrosomal protein 4 [Intoshia linei]|uniref:Centrosomal protein 4 n=1 Tax=Intoshia linei TaxID=1819745 RepID=A0A177B7N7_9BILA|nr:Centrosomal protein 4 [Intoshia linei]